MTSSELQPVIEQLEILQEDADVCKNVRKKLEDVAKILRTEQPLAVEKSLLALEELNSREISSFHRTQLWDIISMLEGLGK